MRCCKSANSITTILNAGTELLRRGWRPLAFLLSRTTLLHQVDEDPESAQHKDKDAYVSRTLGLWIDVSYSAERNRDRGKKKTHTHPHHKS